VNLSRTTGWVGLSLGRHARASRRFCIALICLFSLALSMMSAARADVDGLLDPSDAFRVSVKELPGAVRIDFRVADGYYVYREQFGFVASDPKVGLGTPAIPHGTVHFDQTFDKDVETYRRAVSAIVPVLKNGGPFELSVAYQGCSDKGVCYPPMKRTFKIHGAALETAPPGALAEETAALASQSDISPSNEAKGLDQIYSQDYATSVLEGRSLPVVLGIFFLLGVALSLLPCSLPMIPILSSIILGEGAGLTRRRGFALSLTYVLGMALVYTLFGVAAALAGGSLGAALQNPWMLGGFGILLVVLALSQMGCYELQLPSAWQSRASGASQRLSGGKTFAVFLMGALSALVVGACMTAPLFGVLAFIAQTGNVLLGAASLFMMALGIGVPLLIVGIGAGSILPRAGAWMHGVRRAFGVLLLGAAVWITAPVLPGGLNLLLWAVVALLAAFGLGTFTAAAPDSSASGTWRWIGRALGAGAALFAVALVFGATAGSRDPMHPLLVFQSAANPGLATAGGQTAGASSGLAGLTFAPVRNLEQLSAATGENGAGGNAGRPSMLVFHANWCTSCIEMERSVFPDPAVAAQMRQFSLLQADVTENNADDQALMKHFGMFGPPAIIFFDAQGHELSSLRVMGYQPADRFAKTLANVLVALSTKPRTTPPTANTLTTAKAGPTPALAPIRVGSGLPNGASRLSPNGNGGGSGSTPQPNHAAAILGAAIAAHAASAGQ